MDQETTYKWIQERLRELNSGTLSEEDRVRLVALAKEDPFVADALEGFHAYPEIDHNNTLETLTKRIKHTRRERRRWLIPNLTITAVAASFLLIIATYAVITRIEKKADESLFVFVAPDSLQTADSVDKDIVMEPEPGVAASTERVVEREEGVSGKTIAEAPPAVSSARKDIKAQPGTRQSESEKPDVTSSEPIKAIQPALVPAAPPAMDDEITMEEKLSTQSQPASAGAMKNEISRAKKDEGYYANQMDPDLMKRRVTGRIVDSQTGHPVMDARIAVGFSNLLFYSDTEGYFELLLPEPEAVIEIIYTGLVDSAFIIRQGEENIQVGLNPGIILDPAVIAGANTKGPVAPAKNPAIESFQNFRSYIASSSTLQLSSNPSSYRRKVVVAFKIKKDGHPTDITILESSRDKTYDGEAMRLIESGPEWYCAGGEFPCMRQYTFYFR